MSANPTNGNDPIARLAAEERDGIRRIDEPVSAGVPLPRGAVPDDGWLRLAGEDGVELPLQTQVTDRWSDGSVRWVVVDTRLDLPARGTTRLAMRVDRQSRPQRGPAIELRRPGLGVFVDTGAARFTLEPGASFPFASVQAGGVEMLAPGSGWHCRDERGTRWTASLEHIEPEVEGPLRATVRLDGGFRGDTVCPLRFVARVHFFAGLASVRLELTVHNPRRAEHAGGHWELGDPGSVRIRDLALQLHLRQAPRVSWSADLSAPLADTGNEPFELYQDSSGGENWRSPVHRVADGSIPVAFRGYRVRLGEVERTGHRATPRVAVHDGKGGVCVTPRWFWENFPAAIEAEDGTVALGLLPRQFAAPHELQGGERKTFHATLSFGREALAESVDAFRAPLLLHADPATFAASRALPYVTPEADDPHALYVRLVRQAVDGPDTFSAKRERIDEWGWRNFGDLWADHEAVASDAPEAFVSHHNNQYDVVHGALQQFARTGDARWHALMEELAWHVADVDVYHTVEDRNAYSGGLFWHTAHYVDAGLSTHRSYPRGASCGGGPDNEHNYPTGLAHRYFLTGNPHFHNAALSAADWAIRAEDGSDTPFHWLDRGPTGLASKTRSLDYHGPGRGAGNSIQALLDGWRLTGEERYLEHCRRILRRTIHPRDDPAAHDLLDAENRWSYTAYLQAVGRFLDEMAEAGRLDDTYAYARASLLTYARWMADHERRTLDEPDRLEYPTETWAAQDVRKTEVFLFAALHATGDERDRFLERARWFLDESLARLDSFETKSRLRPVVLLMRYGFMAAWFHHHPEDARPPGPVGADFGEPARFVPQRLRALARARRLVVLGGALVGLAALVVIRLLSG